MEKSQDALILCKFSPGYCYQHLQTNYVYIYIYIYQNNFRNLCKFSTFIFRLIVIADKDMVYTSYPIPLINRLEKHFLVTSTSMSDNELKLTDQLKQWVKTFAVMKVDKYVLVFPIYIYIIS